PPARRAACAAPAVGVLMPSSRRVELGLAGPRCASSPPLPRCRLPGGQLHRRGPDGAATSPAIADPAMPPQLARHASRRARQAHQASGQHPVHQRLLTLREERRGQVVAGALTAGAPGAFAPGAIVVRAPRVDLLALAPGDTGGAARSIAAYGW